MKKELSLSFVWNYRIKLRAEGDKLRAEGDFRSFWQYQD